MRSLIEQQIKEMGSAKVQLCMWVKWKKSEEMVIQLTPEEFEEAEDIPGEVYEIIVEKAFNSKMMEIFQGSNIEKYWSKCLPISRHKLRTQRCQSLALPWIASCT